jgi:hypothetical protein
MDIHLWHIRNILTRHTDVNLEWTNKQKEVGRMWWPRGWGYMNPYMHPLYSPYAPAPFMPPQPTPEQEIEMLETYKAEIEEELKGVEARIKELRDLLAKKQGS